MKKACVLFVVSLCYLLLAVPGEAILKLSLQPLQNRVLEERPMTIYLVLENTGSTPVYIYDQYLIPQNFDFEIENYEGHKIPQMALLPLKTSMVSENRLLKPGETLRFPVHNLNDYYQVAARNIYRIRGIYRGSETIKSDQVEVEVGNYLGELGFLVYSDTAYIKNQFDLTFVSAGESNLRSFSNQFYLAGLNQKRLQLGLSLFGGLGLGAKFQFLEESGWIPAASVWGNYSDTKSLYFSSGYQLFTRYDHMESVGAVFSKQIIPGTHLHVLSKYYDNSFALADGVLKKQGITLHGLGLDTRFWVGVTTYEANLRPDTNALNEAIVFHFFPSWYPQVGLGYERQSIAGQFNYQQLFLTLRFMDFNSLFKF